MIVLVMFSQDLDHSLIHQQFQHSLSLSYPHQLQQHLQHQVPVQKSSASQSFNNPSDDLAAIENPLMDSIDQDIAEVAGEVRHMSGLPSIMQHPLQHDQQLPNQQRLQGEQGFEIPLDPNLVCSKCGKMFRHGEIQKLRQHYDQCKGKL